jgi:dimeric dUTPase (all-alpha-NTP-PPase superfamily)
MILPDHRTATFNKMPGELSVMKQQFITMLTMQDQMNTKVHPGWIAQHFEWYRALWIECGELIDHYGYKWWKKQTPDMQQVKLEIVDIWHFGLSMLFDESKDIPGIAAQMVDELAANTVPELGVREATEELAVFTLAERRFSVARFWSLLNAADMSADELYEAYVGKNVLNFFRQDQGYQEGTYLKQWDGREDNEHLVELIAGLDSSLPSFGEDLYRALDHRYNEIMAVS